MVEPAQMTGQDEDVQLPFEPKTLFLGLWQVRWLLVAWTIMSMVIGLAAGILGGGRSYQADTIIRYRPSPRSGFVAASDASEVIFSAMQFAKTRPNIEEVRRRLQIPLTIQAVGAMIDVQTVRGSSLLTISAKSEDPTQAAAIANTMRDVFLDDQLSIRLRDDLGRAQQAEQQARDEVHALESRIPGYEEEIGRLEMRRKTEARDAPDIVDPTKAIFVLQNKIEQERQRTLNLLALNKAEADLRDAERLYALELISAKQVEDSRDIYDRTKSVVDDSPALKSLKAQLERLQGQSMSLAAENPTAQLLLDMKKSLVDSQLQLISTRDKQVRLAADRHRVEGMLTALASGDPDAGEVEGGSVLGEGWRQAESDFRIVTTAQVPIAPADSSRKITAIMVAGLLSFLGCGAALVNGLLDTTIKSGAELTLRLGVPTLAVLPKLASNTRLLPTIADPAVLETFGVLARRIRAAAPGSTARIVVLSAVHGEGCSAVATNLAAVLGRQEGCVLLVDAAVRSPLEGPAVTGRAKPRSWPFSKSSRPQEIPSTNGAAVAAAGHASVGRSARAAGHSIPGRQRHAMRDLLPSNPEGDMFGEKVGLERDSPHVPGLGAYLSSDELEFDLVAWPTVLPGVYCIPRTEESVAPDLLASNRMRQLMMEASARFPIVIVDGPPILPYADAVSLTQWVDGVVLVVEAQRCTAAELKSAIQRISATSVPIIGAVLNRTNPIYLGI